MKSRQSFVRLEDIFGKKENVYLTTYFGLFGNNQVLTCIYLFII
jgi:hypothetical protein